MEVADALFEETANRARVSVNGGKFGQAYALFLLLLKLKPDRKSSLEEEFCDVWYAWSSELVRLNKLDKMVELYYTGCEYFHESERFHMITANWFYKLHDKLRAHSTYEYILQLNSSNIDARENLDNLCRSIIDNWHYDMLNDTGRNWTFYKAIKDCLSSISTMLGNDEKVKIVDIGSGTGLLSMFCCMNVDSSVVACECDQVMAKLGRDIIRSNGFEAKITFLNCLSTEVLVEGQNEIPYSGRANLVISEILDAGLFGEGIVPAIDHAWRELLTPQEKGGMVIPSKATIKVTCVQCEEIHKNHCASIESTTAPILAVSNVGIEIDSEGLSGHWHPMISMQEPYTCGRVGDLSHKMITDYEELKEVNFNSVEDMSQLVKAAGDPFSIELTSLSDGYLDAVITSFDLFLGRNHVLNTHIGSEGCWEQCIYPIRYVTQVNGIFQFSRIFVKSNSTIILKFLQYSDKIMLDSCILTNMGETRTFPQKNPFEAMSQCNNYKILSLQEQDITKLNDLRFLEFFIESVSGLVCQTSMLHESLDGSLNIIDLYLARPLLALCIAKKFPHINVCRIKDTSQNSIYFQECTQRLSIPNLVCTELRPGLKFAAAIVDVVEHSGLLSESIFTNIMENRRLLNSNGHFFPCKLRVMGQIVQSDQLLKRCTIPEKSATVGLDIGSHLYPFRPSTISHLNMHNIKYTALSQPFMCEEIDFKQCSGKMLYENKFNISTDVNEGTVHGILIWYVMIGNDNQTFDTLNSANSWQQCVYMHRDSPIGVVAGHALPLVYWRKSSYISFEFVRHLI